MLVLKLPDNVEKRLIALAKRTNRTKSFYAREAILLHVEDLEDCYDAIEVLKNPGRIYSMEEIEEKYDLAS